MKKPSGRGEWMLWATPIVALVPLALAPAASALRGRMQLLSDIWQEQVLGYKSRTSARRASCQSNLKQLSLAMLQYTQDNGDRFPPATIGVLSVGDQRAYVDGDKVTRTGPPVGWTGAIFSYTRDQELQFCPAQNTKASQASLPREARSPTSRGFVDYWLNARLAGRVTSTYHTPSSTFLLGEGNNAFDLSNSTYSKSQFPQHWLLDVRSPLYRHNDGSNYAFADGHVKWLRPQEAQRYGQRLDPFAP